MQNVFVMKVLDMTPHFPIGVVFVTTDWNWFLSMICKYRSFPNCRGLTLRKVGCKSNFTQVGFGYTCIQQHKMESSWNINSQRTGTWWSAACHLRHLCYHPTVYFCHLRLIALSVPREKLRTVFFKNIFILFFIKLHMSKMLERGIARDGKSERFYQNVHTCL